MHSTRSWLVLLVLALAVLFSVSEVSAGKSLTSRRASLQRRTAQALARRDDDDGGDDDDDDDNRGRRVGGRIGGNVGNAGNNVCNRPRTSNCPDDCWSAINGGCVETDTGNFFSGGECTACTGFPVIDD
ncbi:uncharacterized protein EV422DRAFT_578132 [Fimicolochytrium jonesii]|uniref:uncharacterized protein n=1 Tax=Fimicolochytrium jonesii TaxID=1396493 RepID=UPI0022FDE6A8|nr:uncharacterized protein EV422DRAFT_578132 [Fimicolochytrium jonesii]KAI8821872.1 hypothetical protein EV422DRAFT_578132 [Fimicolochytrium jonesii]